MVNVVRREDKDLGSRYLVELELVGPQGQKALVSRYVYAQAEDSKKQTILCSPEAFSWNPSATVHIIVAGENNQIYQYLSFNCAAFKSCWNYHNNETSTLIFDLELLMSLNSTHQISTHLIQVNEWVSTQ